MAEDTGGSDPILLKLSLDISSVLAEIETLEDSFHGVAIAGLSLASSLSASFDLIGGSTKLAAENAKVLAEAVAGIQVKPAVARNYETIAKATDKWAASEAKLAQAITSRNAAMNGSGGGFLADDERGVVGAGDTARRSATRKPANFMFDDGTMQTMNRDYELAREEAYQAAYAKAAKGHRKRPVRDQFMSTFDESEQGAALQESVITNSINKQFDNLEANATAVRDATKAYGREISKLSQQRFYDDPYRFTNYRYDQSYSDLFSGIPTVAQEEAEKAAAEAARQAAVARANARTDARNDSYKPDPFAYRQNDYADVFSSVPTDDELAQRERARALKEAYANGNVANYRSGLDPEGTSRADAKETSFYRSSASYQDVFKSIPPEIEKGSSALERLTKGFGQLGIASRDATSSIFKGFEQNIGGMVRFGIQLAIVQAIVKVMTDTVKELGAALQKAGEFQQQTALFKNTQSVMSNMQGPGFKVTPASDTQYLNASINLASRWGEEINTVSQDLTLWYKRTGDLASAQAMTNETLKFSVATGTQLEDVYRTITGLTAQASKIPLDANVSKKGFGLEQTPELLEKITSAAVVAGAGLDQVSQSGKEMTSSTNNAAVLLLDALDKDAAAMGSLGYDITNTIAINAALIQSFGNTGQSASEAAEKLGRIAGGLAALSKPNNSTLKALAADGINLSSVLKSNGNVLEGLAGIWDKLNARQRNELATAIAGQRQYEAVEAVINGMSGKMQNLIGMSRNKSAEDSLAIQMLGTYQRELAQLNSEWEGFEIAIMTAALPAIQSFIGWLASNGIPTLEHFCFALRETVQDTSDLMHMAADAPAYYFDKLMAKTGFHDDKNSLAEIKRGDDAATNRALFDELEHKDDGQPLVRYHNWTDNKGKRHSEARRYYDQAAFDASGDIAFGAPRQEPDYVKGYEAHLNIENLGNTVHQGIGASAFNHSIKDLLGHQGQQDPAEPFAGEPGGGGKGMLKDYQQGADDNNFRKSLYQDRIEDLKMAVAQTSAAIEKDKEYIRTQGLTSEAIAKLNADTARKAAALNAENSALAAEKSYLVGQEQAALANANAHAKNTEEYRGWLQVALQAKSEIRSLTTEMQSNSQAAEEAANGVQEYREQLADRLYQGAVKSDDTTLHIDTMATAHEPNVGRRQADVSKYNADIDAAYKSEKGMLDSELANHTRSKDSYDTALATLSDRFLQLRQEAADATESVNNFANETHTNLVKLNADAQAGFLDKVLEIGEARGMKSYDISFFKETVAIQKQAADALKTYQEEYKKVQGTPDEGLLNQWYATEQATEAASAAAAEYKRALEAIKDSDWYKGVEIAFKDLGESLAASVEGAVSGRSSNEDQLDDIKQVIDALDQQKSFMDSMYSADHEKSTQLTADHKIYLYLLDEQIRKEKEAEQSAQDRISHPTFIRKIQGDISKSMVESLTKRVMDSFTAGIADNSGQSQANAAMKQYADVTQTIQKSNMDSYANTTQRLQTYMDDFKTTVDDSYLNPNYNGPTNGDNPFAAILSTGGIGQATLKTGGGLASGSNGSGGVLGDASIKKMATSFGESVVREATGGSNEAESADMSAASFGGWGGGGGGILGSLTSGASTLLTKLGFANSSGGVAWNNVASLASSIGNSKSNSAIGQALTTFGQMDGGFKNTAGGGIGIGTYADIAGNILNGFSTSPDAGVGSIVGTGIGFIGGPIGAAIGGSLGEAIGSLFGPKPANTTNNPDEFANDGYAQGVANAGGIAGTSANGTVYEDPMLMEQLGGKTELQYLDQFVNAHPNGTGLSAEEQDLWNQLSSLTGGGTGTQLAGLHNGNIAVQNASGQTVGASGNWQDLITQVQNATQALYEFNQTVGASQAMVVLNQYGTGTASLPYAWNTPGYSYPSSAYQGATSGTPGTTETTVNPVNPTNTSSSPSTGSAGSTVTAPAITSNGAQTFALTINTNLDGKVIAQSTQAFNLQAQAQGYQYVS